MKALQLHEWTQLVADYAAVNPMDCCFQFNNEIDEVSQLPRKIMAHRKLLVLSPVLATTLEMAEDSTTIPIEDTPSDAFNGLVGFFYTGQIELTLTNIEMNYHLAYKYGCMELAMVCEEYIVQIINPDNVVLFYSLGILYDSDLVQCSCHELISNKTDIVFQSSGFFKCNRETLSLMLTINETDSEEHIIFDQCMKWAIYKCKEKKIDNSPANLRAELGNCWKMINWRQMDQDEIFFRYNFIKSLHDPNETTNLDTIYQLATGETYLQPSAMKVESNLVFKFGQTNKLVQSSDNRTTFRLSHPMQLKGITMSQPSTDGLSIFIPCKIAITIWRDTKRIGSEIFTTTKYDYGYFQLATAVIVGGAVDYSIEIKFIEPITQYGCAWHVTHAFKKQTRSNFTIIPMEDDEEDTNDGNETSIRELHLSPCGFTK